MATEPRSAADLRVASSPAGESRWRGWFAPAQGNRPLPVDLAPAAAAAFVQVVGTFLYSQDEPSPWDLDAFAYLLLMAGPAGLLFRRHWPRAVLLLAFFASAGYVAGGYPRGPAGLPALLLALVSAIIMGRRWFAWSVLVVALASFSWLPSLLPDQQERLQTATGRVTGLGWLVLACAGSEVARVRRERSADRAATARELAQRRASEERLLIVRELHDTLAHTISLINVRSGVALHLLDDQPEQARPALAAINEASEEALEELRAVLDVIAAGWAPRAPTAGQRDLDGLVRRTRAAGIDVTLRVEGEVRQVPAGVDLAAFRIVQEALTNVVRHAGGGVRAAVRVAYVPGALTVRVDDDGAGPDGPAGRGITGMRERVHALGGTFTAGPHPDRGFRVSARFPLPDPAR